MFFRQRTDEELLREYKDGNHLAFEMLYRRHRRRLWDMAKRLSWNVRQAENLLVEAMAIVAEDARKGAIRSSFIGHSLFIVHREGLRELTCRT